MADLTNDHRRRSMKHLSAACRSAAVLLVGVAVAALGADSKSSLLHSAPSQAKPGEAFQVDGSLAGTVEFDSLVLRYRGPGEEFVDVKMELQYGDLYRGTIPAARMQPPGIEYYVEGVKAGERTPLFMNAAKPARVLVLGPDDPIEIKRSTDVEPHDEPVMPPKVKKKKKPCKKGKKCKDVDDDPPGARSKTEDAKPTEGARAESKPGGDKPEVERSGAKTGAKPLSAAAEPATSGMSEEAQPARSDAKAAEGTKVGAASEEPRAESKLAEKPESAKTGVRPEESRADSKAPGKTESTKTGARPDDPRADSKSAGKAETAKAGVKPDEPRADSKSASAKPNLKSDEPAVESRSGGKSENAKPAAKPDEPRADSKAGGKSESTRTGARTDEARTDSKSAGKVDTGAAESRSGSVEPRTGSEEPPRKRSELEEELAIYGAEDSSGVVTRVDEKASRVPQVVTTITAAQMKQWAARTVYDVLDLVPGLTVSRDVAGFYRVAVRGLRGDAEVLFLINGHRLNNLYDGRAFANLPVDNLERIEVIRGPASADVGLGDFLAVVNLVTRTDDGIRAGGTVGLWDTYDGHLGAAKSFGGFKLFLDADVLTQRGARKTVLKDALDLNTISQGKRTALDPAGVTNDKRLLVNVGGGAEYSSEAVGHVKANARFMLESRAALLGAYDTVGNDSQLDWQALLVDLAFDRKLGAVGRWQVRLFYDQQQTRRLFQLSPRDYKVGAELFPEGLFEQVSVGTRTFGAEAGATLLLPLHNRLGVGASFELGSLTSYDYVTNYTPGTNVYVGPRLSRPDGLVYPTEGSAASRLAVGVFAQDEFTPFERLTVQLGVRADLVQLPTADAAGKLSGSTIAAGFGPRAGIVFAPINSLALKAHYGRAFRPPTIQELAETIPNSDVNQGRFIGNPKLSPATVDSVEVGFEYAQTVGDARLKLKGSGFFENFSNPIHPVDPSGNLVPYANRQLGVTVYGAEGEARVELSQRSAGWINGSFFRAEDNGTVSTARLLTDTPQARLNAGFSLPLGPYVNFDVTLRYGSERRNDSRSVLELLRRYTLPGYFVVGAAIRSELILDHVELAIVGQNVFSADYADDVPRPDRITAGVPREGLQVFGTVKVDF